MTTFMSRLFNREGRKHQQTLLEVQVSTARQNMREQAERLNNVINAALTENDRIRLTSRGVSQQ